jgi:hypothetical protein
MADGKGCTCAAHSESECGCDADWTPQEVYDLRAENDRLKTAIRRLADQDATLSVCDGNVTVQMDAAMWVPVKEQLPPRGQMVIVAFRGHWGGKRQVSAEVFWIDDRRGWTGCDSMKDGKPTHWMPLPEPPTE